MRVSAVFFFLSLRLTTSYISIQPNALLTFSFPFFLLPVALFTDVQQPVHDCSSESHWTNLIESFLPSSKLEVSLLKQQYSSNEESNDSTSVNLIGERLDIWHYENRFWTIYFDKHSSEIDAIPFQTVCDRHARKALHSFFFFRRLRKDQLLFLYFSRVRKIDSNNSEINSIFHSLS